MKGVRLSHSQRWTFVLRFNPFAVLRCVDRKKFHLPLNQCSRETVEIIASNGGHEALRASAISAFVNMVHEARLMRLDARKMHLGTAFYAI